MKTQEHFEQVLAYIATEEVVLGPEKTGDKTEPDEWWVEAFIESRGGYYFTLEDVLGSVDVGGTTCMNILKKHPLVEIVTEDYKTKRYFSRAKPLEPTREGLEAIARERTVFDLGYQAEQDFWELVAVRSLALRQRNARKLKV